MTQLQVIKRQPMMSIGCLTLAGLIVIVIIGFYVRGFFYRRKKDLDTDDTVIDAEYTILDNKDSDD